MNANLPLKARCILQRTFAAAISFEIPHPAYTLAQNIAPALDMQLHIYQKESKLPDTYHVELRIWIEASLKQSAEDNQANKKVLFLLEITQGGLFTIPKPIEGSLEEIIHIDCPATLYPYAREFITNLITRAEFIPLYLPPVDFHSMYASHQATSKIKENDA